MSKKSWKQSKDLEKLPQAGDPLVNHPEGKYDAQDEEYLIKRKLELQKTLDQLKDKTSRRKTDTKLFAGVAGSLLLTDMIFLGGAVTIFTCGAGMLSGGYGIGWARNDSNAKTVRLQLDEVEEKLESCRKMKEAAAAAPGKLARPSSATDDFNPSAVRPEDIAARLTDLEKRVNKSAPKSPFDRD